MYIDGLDEMDNKILNAIEHDARLSYSEIGKLVGLSRVAVKNRMDALEEKGIIKEYATITNSEAMSEGTKFFLDIVTEPPMFTQVVDNIAKYPVIRKVYAVSGESRILAEGFAPTKMRYQMFMSNLKRNMDSVRSCTCQDVLLTYKDVDGASNMFKSKIINLILCCRLHRGGNYGKAGNL